ncbi:MAG: ABC transporter ATP-binding protein [Christensenellaceae bacterium]|jgi:branched-chain amino acid transport system ATP-binding protein|nr:ABC transporter ATP-binding protein [Christensenellaceae bacterium]
MLKIENLHVKYGAFQALRGISLEVSEGEIVALLGGNGAGKTTTINTISGLNAPSEGTITFEGVSIADIPVHKRPALGIVQVPEGRKLFPQLTIMENLTVGSYLKHTREKRKENLEMCFEIFPILSERKNQLAGSLSGGEQQMCAIARGLMQQPKLLMLDEPSLGLAPVIVDAMFDVITKINAQGVTILLVEQNVIASLDIASRGYVIETGENVMSGTTEMLLNNEELKRAYLGI